MLSTAAASALSKCYNPSSHLIPKANVIKSSLNFYWSVIKCSLVHMPEYWIQIQVWLVCVTQNRFNGMVTHGIVWSSMQLLTKTAQNTHISYWLWNATKLSFVLRLKNSTEPRQFYDKQYFIYSTYIIPKHAVLHSFSIAWWEVGKVCLMNAQTYLMPHTIRSFFSSFSDDLFSLSMRAKLVFKGMSSLVDCSVVDHMFQLW